MRYVRRYFPLISLISLILMSVFLAETLSMGNQFSLFMVLFLIGLTVWLFSVGGVRVLESDALAFLRQRKPRRDTHDRCPPKFAEYFLWFLPKKTREPLLGDLEEEFHLVYAKFGKWHARLWYWGQVVVSYWPLLRSAARKLVQWGVLSWAGAWVGELVRRFIP